MDDVARESWTDERLDDLNQRMSEGFQRVDADLHDMRRMMFQGFVAQTTITVSCSIGLAGLFAF